MLKSQDIDHSDDIVLMILFAILGTVVVLA